MTDEKHGARVDGQPLSGDGDLPRQTTGLSALQVVLIATDRDCSDYIGADEFVELVARRVVSLLTGSCE